MSTPENIRVIPVENQTDPGEGLQPRAADSPRPAASGDGAVALLLADHERVRALLARVEQSAGSARQEAFDELRELLARHETAEEMVLRPVTRTLDGGAEVASARMEEENQAKQVLAELEKLDVDGPEFLRRFTEFRSAVGEHAAAEESEEFPLLEAGKGSEQLGAIGTALRAAEATAPTHPHPSARSTATNYVAGPFAAMVDRARDALRKISG